MHKMETGSQGDSDKNKVKLVDKGYPPDTQFEVQIGNKRVIGEQRKYVGKDGVLVEQPTQNSTPIKLVDKRLPPEEKFRAKVGNKNIVGQESTFVDKNGVFVQQPAERPLSLGEKIRRVLFGR